MSLLKIDEIYVYTCSATDPVGTHELHAWFDHSNIPHIKLNYNNIAQNEQVLNAVNTWWHYTDIDTWEEVTLDPVPGFPFVVYTEIHANAAISYLPRKYIYGKEAIMSQLPELYNLGR